MLHKAKWLDNYSGYNYRSNEFQSENNAHDGGFEQLPNRMSLISFGEPAVRLMVKYDKRCYRCGLPQCRGFQLDIDEEGWVNCWCPCGFSL